MSTYAIASAIEKLANNFRETIREKNAIEKEKLAFEKEKFEFEKKKLELESNKQQEKCEHEWRYGATGHHYICTKCGTMKVVPLESLSSTDKECDHDWVLWSVLENGFKNINGTKIYICRKCGKKDMRDD